MRKNRFLVPIGVLVLVIGLVAGMQIAAIASRGGAANVATVKPQVHPAAVVTSHKAAKKNYFENDITSISVAAFTPTPVGDLITAQCGLKNCSLEMDQNLQYCSATSGTYYYVEVSVDGGPLDQSPYSGAFGTEFCDTTAWTYQLTGLSPGTHTVQFYAYASAAATVVDYTHTVRVYTP